MPWPQVVHAHSALAFAQSPASRVGEFLDPRWTLIAFGQCSYCVHVLGLSQEIPATFTAETGWPGGEECALVTSISCVKEWPLELRRSSSVHGGVTAVSVGGGWAKFCADQHLRAGAFMTFEIVDESRLVVAIHARGAIEDYQPTAKERVVDATSEPACGDIVPPTVDNNETIPTSRRVLNEESDGSRPQFEKTLRKTHLRNHDGGRLVRP